MALTAMPVQRVAGEVRGVSLEEIESMIPDSDPAISALVLTGRLAMRE